MSFSQFAGRAVLIRTNDFFQMDLAAHIACASETDQKLLLAIDCPITIRGSTYVHAVAMPRLAKDDLTTLLNSGSLGCSITWVSNDKFDSDRPFDLTWWRGGAAAVADVVLC